MTSPSDSPLIFTVDDSSKVGEARRGGTDLARSLGFDETAQGRLALVITEAATNLLKHAGGGELLLRPIESAAGNAVEILALDRGAGMYDVGRCMVDGFSTAGSSGNGLGAIARLSDTFDVYSRPELGTALLARVGAAPIDQGASLIPGLEFGVVNVPYPGESVSGDAWAVAETAEGDLVMIADGLGHGPQAAEAAEAAVASFNASASLGPARVLNAAHSALRSTRGAAMAVALIDREKNEVRYAGVGNISGVLWNPNLDRTSSLASRNGTVGHTVAKVQEFTYPWSPSSLLVMHSDGLATHWQFDRYAGLPARHPGLIAGVLFRDFKRGRDDVTVLAARDRESMA